MVDITIGITGTGAMAAAFQEEVAEAFTMAAGAVDMVAGAEVTEVEVVCQVEVDAEDRVEVWVRECQAVVVDAEDRVEECQVEVCQVVAVEDRVEVCQVVVDAENRV